MALRKIVTVGDPILTKVCRPVTRFDQKLAILIEDMIETMHNANGVGLAGPQVVQGAAGAAAAARGHRKIRSDSSSHTGVSAPGSRGSVPRSVCDSSGLWKSLPRDAARPNSCAMSA